ncbi:hypothetical protein [Duganella sp. Root336D2]|nr:hypothetical protein [Duganella sp. Root336D2]KRC02735.1 hypothetical protein ASE26_16085 [Duganella sp. Root198D2]
MSQGLHEWQTSSGKLILVVGSYQDVTSFHRSYSFYFKTNGDQDWNQVPLMPKNSGMEFTWESASGGDVLLADGIVVSRQEGTYFVVASRNSDKGYSAAGAANATWYQFVETDGSDPGQPAYSLQPVFTRPYGKVKNGVEEILAKEALLKPAR